MSTQKTIKRTGAWLCIKALEQLPVSYTFGIPGLQNTELYDELNKSSKLTPVLVTHEGGAAFMADGTSRTSNQIGTLVIVPSAGVTHAMSGIAEAYLDGIPMLIISGGIRSDTSVSYQLHEWDQHMVLQGFTKKTFLIRNHGDIVPTIFEAYRIATSGEPGPVFIEIPVNIQLFKGIAPDSIEYQPLPEKSRTNLTKINQAVDMIHSATFPGLFVGWGCRDCSETLITFAERLNAPVATTLQGLSVFPASHPLHTGMGIGPHAVPASENAFSKCDCLIAVGTRFAEIPTGSFGMKVPKKLIHIDINPEVFNKNYPAAVAVEGDAGMTLQAILKELDYTKYISPIPAEPLKKRIKTDKAKYREEWLKMDSEKVNPALFFQTLRSRLPEDSFLVVDDGNHTFLAAELYDVYQSKHFISPTDFNCMGYCVPAAIGTKLANPDKTVAGIVGDGAFLMTCMEILTATSLNLGVVYFVFHDGELAQISQGQEIPYNRKTCSILGEIQLDGVAKATGAAFLPMPDNQHIETVIDEALGIAEKGQPVIVDVAIDYSRRTRFTKGVVSTVLKRFPLGDKFRFIGRALDRKIRG